MLTEVMEHFGLRQELHTAGFYETEHHRQIIKDIRATVGGGRLIAVTGIVGSGKTLLLRRLQAELDREGKVLVSKWTPLKTPPTRLEAHNKALKSLHFEFALGRFLEVSKSLSVDKDRTTLPTLIAALFYDLSPDKEPRISKQGERRERDLQELFRRGRKPVALFVDEAHDLHAKTLIGLKRLMEVVADGGGTLSIVLAGHPKLRNDLRRPTMEDIGYRATVFSFDGIAGNQREYIDWLLQTCAAEKTKSAELIDDAAINLLAAKLRTPLQIEQHLSLAFEEAFRVGEKPVTVEVIEAILSRQIDDLEPKLMRHGYDVRILANQFNAKPVEIRQFLQGALDGDRARELTDQMLAAGLPL